MAAELPGDLTQEDLDRYARLSSGITALSAEKAILNTKIKKAFEGLAPGTRIFDGVIVKIALTSTYDAKGFEGKYPFSEYPSYYVAALNTKELPADRKAEFTTKAPRLSVESAVPAE